MGEIVDVAVLGGGLAGSSMAGVLSRMGWTTVLMDQHTFPRHKVCGEFLSPESQASLVALGLDDRIRSLRPSEMDKVKVTLASGLCLDIPLPGIALGVSRYALDNELHQMLQTHGVDVQLGIVVTSVCRSKHGYTIKTQQRSHEQSIEARVVIGAWGRSVRSSLVNTNTKSNDLSSYMGVKAHFEGIPSDRAVELYFFPGGYLGLSPIEGGRMNAAALITREAFHQAGKTVQGAIQLASHCNLALQQRLAKARWVPESQAAVSPVNISSKPVAWGQVPHIGDAAIVIPPLCGDGMAMALRSVELSAILANSFLKGELSLAQWQHKYTHAVQKQFSGPLRWGRLLQVALGNPLLASIVLSTGRQLPSLAYRMVQATRLKAIVP